MSLTQARPPSTIKLYWGRGSEDVLVKRGKFRLHGKKVLLDNREREAELVDVTESPIECPKKTAKMAFRQKGTPYHQNQVIVERENGISMCMACAGRSTHDFRLYEENVGGAITTSIKVQGGSGYRGILKIHRNSEIPKKNRKDGALRG